MTTEEKFEGIVLRSQDYQERHRIITLFSEAGIVTLIVKNISRKNARMLSLSTVFTHAEYLVKRSRGEMYTFADATLIDEHLSLRGSLASIQTAASLTQAILSSQLPGKTSPALFHLYKSYLKQIPAFPDPSSLLASFQIKLLKHEGLLAPSEESPYATRFSPEDWRIVKALHLVQQFSQLRTLAIPPSISTKITTLFQESLGGC